MQQVGRCPCPCMESAAEGGHVTSLALVIVCIHDISWGCIIQVVNSYTRKPLTPENAPRSKHGCALGTSPVTSYSRVKDKHGANGSEKKYRHHHSTNPTITLSQNPWLHNTSQGILLEVLLEISKECNQHKALIVPKTLPPSLSAFHHIQSWETAFHHIQSWEHIRFVCTSTQRKPLSFNCAFSFTRS